MKSFAGSDRDPDDLGGPVGAGSKEAAYRAFDKHWLFLLEKLRRRFGATLDPEDREEVLGKVLARFVRDPAARRSAWALDR